MKVIIVVACLLGIAAGNEIDPNIELPSFLHICKLTDPKRNECIKESIETILPELRKGHHGFKLPEIDPFIPDERSFKYKDINQLFNGDYDFSNMKTFGVSTAEVQSVKSSFINGTMKLQVEIIIPKMSTSSDYNSNMKFGFMSFPSKGDFNITMKGFKAFFNMKGIIENINGEGYLKIIKASMVPKDINDMKIEMSGMFPDETLNNMVVSFFNRHWRFFYKDITNMAIKQWGTCVQMLQTLNDFFSQVPFKRLLITK